MAVQITQGTQTSIYTKTNAGTDTQVVKLDIGSGTALLDFGGTILTVGTLNAGTVTSTLTSNGTLLALAAGTITTGTVDSVSQIPLNSWGTSTNTTGTAFGTIKPAVAGSSIYITDLLISMSVVNGTIALYNGANTNLLAGSWAFNANGGLIENFRVPIQTLSGSALCYQQQGTASVGITAQGFVR